MFGLLVAAVSLGIVFMFMGIGWKVGEWMNDPDQEWGLAFAIIFGGLGAGVAYLIGSALTR